MVLQAETDRQVGHHRHAELREVTGRPDARAQKDGRGMDRAGCEDHLRGTELHDFARPPAGDSASAAVLDEHPLDEGLTVDRQVAALARGLEVAVVGGHALAVAAVVRVGRDARRAGRVVIGLPDVAEAECRVAEGDIERVEIVGSGPGDGNRPAAAVVVGAGEILIVLEPDEQWQHVCVRPATASLRRPFVEILDRRPNGEQSVDRRAAPHSAATQIGRGLLSGSATGKQAGIVKVVHPTLRRGGVTGVDGADRAAELDRQWHWIEVANQRVRRAAAVVRPSFQQQHLPRRLLGQARGQGRAGRPRADDDDIELSRHVRLRRSNANEVSLLHQRGRGCNRRAGTRKPMRTRLMTIVTSP